MSRWTFFWGVVAWTFLLALLIFLTLIVIEPTELPTLCPMPTER